MKKFIALLLFPQFLLAQTSVTKGYTINGEIKGLKDSTLVFFNDAQGNAVAQDYAKDGKFKLAGKLNETTLGQIGLTGYTDMIDMFINNENITITGSSTALKTVTITGSKTQTEYNSFTKFFLPINEKMSKILTQVNATPAGKKRDSLIAIFEADKKLIANTVNKILIDKNSSVVSSFLLLQFYPIYGKEDVLEQKYKLLKGEAHKGIFAKMIEQKIELAHKPEPGGIGAMAADFTQNDVDGKPVSLSSFKGKYLLLDFWASWCGPCRRENPAVVQAYNNYKDKNFTILGVSLDQDKAKWLQAIAQDNLKWTHVSDLKSWSNSAAQLYGVQSIPQNYLLDPTGKIIAKNLRGEELAAKLKEILK